MRDSPVPTDLPTIGDRLSAWLGIGPTHAEVEAVAHDLILRHGVWAHDEAIHLSEVARFIGSARNAKLLPACGRSNKALVRGCVGKHSPKANQRGRPVTDRSGMVFVNPRVNVRCHGFSLLNEPQRIFLLDRSNPLLEISFECMHLLRITSPGARRVQIAGSPLEFRSPHSNEGRSCAFLRQDCAK
jgi:hypothetical protein